MSDFFNMGGYAVYVWSSWGLAALIIIIHYLLPVIENKRIKQSILRQLSREKTQQDNGKTEI